MVNINLNSIPKCISLKKYFIFVETTLGLDMNSQSEENPDFLHNAEQILGITAQRFFQPWIQPAWLFRLSKYAKPYYHGVNVLNKLLEKVDVCT